MALFQHSFFLSCNFQVETSLVQFRYLFTIFRAIYRNADVYLLDDPLASAENKIGRHIFEKYFISLFYIYFFLVLCLFLDLCWPVQIQTLGLSVLPNIIYLILLNWNNCYLMSHSNYYIYQLLLSLLSKITQNIAHILFWDWICCINTEKICAITMTYLLKIFIFQLYSRITEG